MVTEPLQDFPRRFRDALSSRIPATIHEEGPRRAAVAVIVSQGADPALLFVKRMEREADPWSGHAAFPGGFQSHPGETPDQTAQRETEEETGLPLASAGELIGRLDDVYPRSVHLPRVIVSPCVFIVSERLEVRPVGEIADALWVPVQEIFSSANRRPYVLTLPSGNREFDSIHAGGLVIWGLTERILQQVVTLSAA